MQGKTESRRRLLREIDGMRSKGSVILDKVGDLSSKLKVLNKKAETLATTQDGGTSDDPHVFLIVKYQVEHCLFE